MKCTKEIHQSAINLINCRFMSPQKEDHFLHVINFPTLFPSSKVFKMMVFTIQVGVIFSYISNPTNHDFYIHKVLMPVNLTQIIDIYIYIYIFFFFDR